MSDSPPRRISGSSVLAAALVLGAGAIAWFGSAGAGGPEAPGPALTLAAPPADRGANPMTRVVSRGGLPTRVVIPAAQVDTPVVELGVVLDDGQPQWQTAWHAAGHHMDSALPGQPGNMVITGHVSVADRGNLAVFADLEDLAVGDAIDVSSGETTYRYQVTGVEVVAPEAVGVLRSDSSSMVTLITCTKDLRHRLVVTGRLSGVVTPGITA